MPRSSHAEFYARKLHAGCIAFCDSDSCAKLHADGVVKSCAKLSGISFSTGKIGIYNSKSKAYLNQRVGNIRLYCTAKSALLYRNIFINSQQKKILEMAYGGAQPNISGEKICGLLFPLPPLAEQRRIVQTIEQYNSILEAISK